MEYVVSIFAEPAGGYSARIPGQPNGVECITCHDTLYDVVQHAREALAACLDDDDAAGMAVLRPVLWEGSVEDWGEWDGRSPLWEPTHTPRYRCTGCGTTYGAHPGFRCHVADCSGSILAE